MNKLITFGPDTRNDVIGGVQLIMKAVITTLGPNGKNVLIYNGKKAQITKDGVTAAKAVEREDVYEQIGVSLIQSAARRTNAIAGDGTTTTTLLTGQLMIEGNYWVNLKYSAIDLKKGFELAKKDVLKYINEHKREVETEDDIFNVAKISANNDEFIGNIIKEAFTSIGDDGIVALGQSTKKDGSTYVEVSAGLKIPAGYCSSLSANKKDMSVVYDNCFVLIAEELPSDIQALQPIVQFAKKEKRPLLIYAKSIDRDLHTHLCNAAKGGADVTWVIDPGATKDEVSNNLRDMAAILDGDVLGTVSLGLDTFSPRKHLGKAKDVRITADRMIISAEEETEGFLKYKKELKEMIDEGDANGTLSMYELDRMKDRLAKLSGGVATIKIGSASGVEFDEALDRYEDAVNAVRASINNGIVVGGGTALLKAAAYCKSKKHKFENSIVEKGYNTLLKVIRKPSFCIIESVLEDEAALMQAQVESNPAFEQGYNAKTGKLVDDLYAEGVVDPVLVIETALTQAVSVAGTFITTDCIIASDLKNISYRPNDEELVDYE